LLILPQVLRRFPPVTTALGLALHDPSRRHTGQSHREQPSPVLERKTKEKLGSFSFTLFYFYYYVLFAFLV